MALYQKLFVTRSTICVESFILVSQSAQNDLCCSTFTNYIHYHNLILLRYSTSPAFICNHAGVYLNAAFVLGNTVLSRHLVVCSAAQEAVMPHHGYIDRKTKNVTCTPM